MKIVHTLIAASLFVGTIGAAPLFAAGIEVPTDVSQKAKPATIKILIGKEKEKILLEAKGRFHIYNPYNDLLVTEGVSSKRHWLSSSGSGLKWGELLPGIFQIRLVPGDSQSSLLVDGIEYRGCVEVYDIQGKLHVVNEVDIERYLKSIMTSQFPNEMDEEVMDAVAIAARTNAYYLVSRKLDAPWHIESEEVGYQGYAVSSQNLPIDRAINSTRHMVMTYKGVTFPTAWTKDSAGKTADFAMIFRKKVSVPHGVESPFAERDRQKHAWTFVMTKQELAKTLGASKVNAFELYQDSKSQKVYAARVKDGADFHQFDFTKLQQALGSVRLKSNDFTIENAGDRIIFKGFGEGAGVGLCLYSASAMADKGDKAPKILASFFPETKLENIRTLGKTKVLLTDTNASYDRQ